jgi:hypothetical protein
MNRHGLVTGGIALVAALVWTRPSRADNVVVEQPAPAPAPAASPSAVVVAPSSAPATTDQATYTGPDRRLITSGLVTFGLSYVPSLIVAGTSDVSADHHLYVPIAGPWLDLGDRPGCGPGHIGCDSETTYKVLLVFDGIFQAIGAATTVVGFLTPEHHAVVTTAKADKLTLHVTPAAVGPSAYGLAALGSF